MGGAGPQRGTTSGTTQHRSKYRNFNILLVCPEPFAGCKYQLTARSWRWEQERACRELQQQAQLAAASAASPLRRGRGPALDGFAFGNVSLGYLGRKAASAVGAGHVVWIFNGGQRRHIGRLPALGEHLLHLPGLAQGLDEDLVLLPPVVPPGWLILQKGNAVRAAGAVGLCSQPPSQGPTWVTPP